MRTRVLPYKKGSKSAKALAEGLGTLRLRTTGSKFRPRKDDVIIGWGSSVRPENLKDARILNDPDKVQTASNKLQYFRTMKYSAPQAIPEFWDNAGDIPDDAFPVVCRTVLNGHSGDGIVIAETRDELVPAPLYVQYVKKQSEYRIHVGRGGVLISEQRKARLRSVPDEDVNWKIRNHANGFVFARRGVEAPEPVREVAKLAVSALDLDFGAVDVIYNEREGRAFALEVNTAPGLEGSTVDDYVTYFKEELNVRCSNVHGSARGR